MSVTCSEITREMRSEIIREMRGTANDCARSGGARSGCSSCSGAAVVRLWRGRSQQLLGALYECAAHPLGAARAGPPGLHGDAEDAEAHKRGEASGEGGEEREQAEGACDAKLRLQLDCTQRTSTQMSRYV